MQRVLIVSAEASLRESLEKRLPPEYQFESCGTGAWGVEYLRLFMPDVVVVDTNIPDMDAFSLIRAIRASGERVGIVLVTSLLNELVYAKIFALQIECTVRKPYNMSVLAGYINNIAVWMQKPNQTAFLPENLVDTLLIDLGFSAGMDKYQLVKRTILARYYGAPGMLMKQVYLDVAKTTGNNNQIEKAVRDAINAAWEKGVRGLWDVYFRMHKKKENGAPTNEEFVSRMAEALRNCERLKTEYDRNQNKLA